MTGISWQTALSGVETRLPPRSWDRPSSNCSSVSCCTWAAPLPRRAAMRLKGLGEGALADAPDANAAFDSAVGEVVPIAACTRSGVGHGSDFLVREKDA